MSDPHSVIVCPACDLLIERKLLPMRRHAHCPRCHQHLYGRYAFRPSQLMALTITGFLLLPSTLFEPLLYLRLAGVNSDANLLKGILMLFGEGELWVASLVLCTGASGAATRHLFARLRPCQALAHAGPDAQGRRGVPALGHAGGLHRQSDGRPVQAH